MKLRSLASSIVAAGLLGAPVMARAGTKASAAVSAPVSLGSRTSTGVSSQQRAKGAAGRVLLSLGAAGGVALGLKTIFDNREKTAGAI